jgi:predicted nucleic acid-binding protein
MAVLIASSVFIALERRGAGPDAVRTLVPDEPVALAAVSASELLFGVERAGYHTGIAQLETCVPRRV